MIAQIKKLNNQHLCLNCQQIKVTRIKLWKYDLIRLIDLRTCFLKVSHHFQLTLYSTKHERVD